MRHAAVLKGGLFYSGVSLLLLLAGLVVLLYGWEFFRAVLFPWAFLILMIPIPSFVLQTITFSLEVPTLKLSVFLLQLIAGPVVVHGNMIAVQSDLVLFDFESGMLSLLTPLTVAIIHGYLADNRRWVRAMLVFASVPTAIVADSFSIVGIFLVAQLWGPDAVKLFSPYSGWIIFAVSLMMLFIFHRLILRIWGDGKDAEYSLHLPPTHTSTLGYH
jgi:exosortase